MSYLRYVAIGDSQTEGLGDPHQEGGWRGWADRLAEHLNRLNPGLHYANLAVRGRLAVQVRAEQLGPALALRPDLTTVMAGMNDLIRPGFTPEQVVACLDDMFAALTAAGSHVATVTYPDIGRICPLARPLRSRVLDLNAGIRESAARHSVILVDTFDHDVTVDARLWSADRIHASPLGHARIASAFAHALGFPDSDATWTRPLPPTAPRTAWATATTELRWLASFLGPWLHRRLRGRSSGDDRVAKRPHLAPFTAAATGPAGSRPE